MIQSKALVATLALLAGTSALAQNPPQPQSQDDYRAQMRAVTWKTRQSSMYQRSVASSMPPMAPSS
jgi:hypothetical protein